MTSLNASSTGVGGPGQRESSCALTSISGCQTSGGMFSGTPCLLVAMADSFNGVYFWIEKPLRLRRQSVRSTYSPMLLITPPEFASSTSTILLLLCAYLANQTGA